VNEGVIVPLAHPLPDQLVDLVAERFRVLGEPTRIRLLELLRHGEATVQELADGTASTQQNVSKHLGILRGAGLVSRRKAGTSSRYAIADSTVFDLCELVCGSVAQQAEALRELAAAGGRG
jgi:DNA-binding transcriptional ArsR family regulator